MNEEKESSLELVMPFVTVSSKGGIHEDGSYAAGWQMGWLDSTLQSSSENVERIKMTIMTANLPQADLIAMRHGFVMESEVTEVEEWSTVTFQRPGEKK